MNRKVRTGYLEIARENPERVKVLDGTLDPMDIEREIRRYVRLLLIKKGMLG